MIERFFRGKIFEVKMKEDIRKEDGFKLIPIPPGPKVDHVYVPLVKQIEKSAVTVVVAYFAASTIRGTIFVLANAKANGA